MLRARSHHAGQDRRITRHCLRVAASLCCGTGCPTLLRLKWQAPSRSAQSPQSSRARAAEVGASLAELDDVVARAAEGGAASVTASAELPTLSAAFAGVRERLMPADASCTDTHGGSAAIDRSRSKLITSA